MSKWISSKQFKGVQYREHETRRHGRQLDRYYRIRYTIGSQTFCDALGWASQGINESRAGGMIAEFKDNFLKGEGPISLKEKKQLIEDGRNAQMQAAELADKINKTFDELFESEYLPKSNNSPENLRVKKSFYGVWIKDAIGNMKLSEIKPEHLEALRDKMIAAGKAPSYVSGTLTLISAVFNFAITYELYDGKNPLGRNSRVKMQPYDNKKLRYLTREEADALLNELKPASFMSYAVALTSLHTAMRFGEVVNLKWSDIDITNRIITIRKTIQVAATKGRSRQVYMTDALVEMFNGLTKGNPNEFVFTDANGEKKKFVGGAFVNAVKRLKLNEHIADRRQKVTFHTLRHTAASWMVQSGIDLFTVSKILGHSNLQMTMRYSHMDPERIKVITDVFK